MLAGFLVVLLVEAAHELLEDRAHRVVVESGRGEVDRRIEELLDQRSDRIGSRQARDLVAELVRVEDLLHVGRDPVEISLEVEPQLLLARPGAEAAQRELDVL